MISLVQQILKCFVLLDEVASLFIALTGISFETLPPSTSVLFFLFIDQSQEGKNASSYIHVTTTFSSCSSSFSSSGGHGSEDMRVGL